jgi:hypothetical protein
VLPAELVAALPDALAADLTACLRCWSRRDRTRIHCVHVERVHHRFGPFAVPLEPWLAERARAARPELAGTALLVAETDAVLVHPAELYRRHLERLLTLAVPDVMLDDVRTRIAETERHDVRIEWERVHAWPCEAEFPGTIGFAEIARTLAEYTLPRLAGDATMLEAIERAASRLMLDDADRAYRDRLAATAEDAAGPASAAGRELAVRFLDELGHTGLRTNQDTLVDDCYFTLLHARRTDAAGVFHAWLELGVPRAWRRLANAAGSLGDRTAAL